VCRISGWEWAKCALGSQLMEAWLRAKEAEEKARIGPLRYWFQSRWSNYFSRSSKNRRQRGCLWVGFLLLVGVTLFPPWTYSYRSRSPDSSSVSSYGFLFRPPAGGARVDLNRLFVEWVLIVLVASGFFLSQAKRPTLTTEHEPDPLASAGPSSMKGGSLHRLEFPGAPPDIIAHVDDKGRVTIWDNKRPIPTGIGANLTRDQMEASGFEFKAATEDAISRHTGLHRLENPKTYGAGKLLQRKFVIPMVVALATVTIGLGYYGSRRIARDLPPTEVSKLAGKAYITNYGRFEWKAYNGCDFVLTEVTVSISVSDEKGNAVISNRVYRVPAFDFYPQQTKELGTDVGFTLEQGQKWGFYIVGAKGRPE
jgi:hypothetical protein